MAVEDKADTLTSLGVPVGAENKKTSTDSKIYSQSFGEFIILMTFA